MARVVSSSDIIAMCLIAADCDVGLSVEEAIRRVEQYEARPGFDFGLEPGEFRGAFWNLALFELSVCRLDELVDSETSPLASIPFRDWIGPILGYDAVYCNDEGEAGTKDDGLAAGDNRSYVERNRRMREFFAERSHLEREAITGFLKRQHIDEEVLRMPKEWWEEF